MPGARTSAKPSCRTKASTTNQATAVPAARPTTPTNPAVMSAIPTAIVARGPNRSLARRDSGAPTTSPTDSGMSSSPVCNGV